MLQSLGLGDVAFRQYQRWLARRDEGAPGANADPLLPPAYLRVLTAGRADADSFVRLGRSAADAFLAAAERHGGTGERVLEFGVGCGRVARWLAPRVPAFDGCDVNPALLEWAQAHLPGRYRRTRLEPPLPYADGEFSFVYALSVFTHMHEPAARAWFAELSRVVRPGGLAAVTFFDEALPQADAIRARLERDGYAVLHEGAEGSNLMCGYFTAAGVADRAGPGWAVAETAGSPETGIGQALAVLRRT